MKTLPTLLLLALAGCAAVAGDDEPETSAQSAALATASYFIDPVFGSASR